MENIEWDHASLDLEDFNHEDQDHAWRPIGTQIWIWYSADSNGGSMKWQKWPILFISIHTFLVMSWHTEVQNPLKICWKSSTSDWRANKERCTLFSPTGRDWWGMWNSSAALTAVTTKWWTSGSLGQQVSIKLTTLHFIRSDFRLFRDMLRGVPWDKALEGRRAQESWLQFKEYLL